MNTYTLEHTTSTEFGEMVASTKPVVVLLPVGSVEPHGPHLTLLTDTLISTASAKRAAACLDEKNMLPVIAPALPYGVTDCAAGFPGAVSIPATTLTLFLGAVVEGFLDNGVDHVCLINNHLEPDQFKALLAVGDGFERSKFSVACPLRRRWARMLTDEFKQGACHAGQYETSIVLAADNKGVKVATSAALPEVPISLSDKLNHGIVTFKDMGMDDAYAGSPAAASVEEGERSLKILADMIVGEIEASLIHQSD